MSLPKVGINLSEEFYWRFDSGSGWGPWSDRFVRRRPLIFKLTTHSDTTIRAWAKKPWKNWTLV